MATYRLTLLTLPLAAASIALGACGAGDSDEATAGSGDRQAEFRDAALKFARCMREHGVDMPDPKPGERGLVIGGPDMEQADRATLERAQEACQKILRSVRPPELSPEQEREFKERALKFARCMREQGIDFPDPKFESGGRMTQALRGSTGPEDPRFRDAMEKCSRYQPGGPRLEHSP
jgi:hypothetical protein